MGAVKALMFEVEDWAGFPSNAWTEQAMQEMDEYYEKEIKPSETN